MNILINTNVLLRLLQRPHPMYSVARNAIAALLRNGSRLYVATQNIVEIRNVCTRPIASNGLGYSVATATRIIARIERTVTFLPDSPAVHPRWKELVATHAVIGIQVHDARLAAFMAVHGISHILTFNDQDFTRYPHVHVLHPSQVA